MTTAQANSAVKVSALVVGAVYLYRRFTEGSAEELKASETVAPLGRWLIGWGVVFFTLSIMAGPFPGFAGELAILIAIATLLLNGIQVSKDLGKGLQSNRHRPVTSQAQHGHEVPGAAAETKPFETRSV